MPYYQYWGRRPMRGLGDMTCPPGTFGYPPACLPDPTGGGGGTAPPISTGNVCPADKPYGVPPYCYALPGTQPPPGGETNQTGPMTTPCPADKPYGVYPWCFGAGQIPSTSTIPGMPTNIPGVPGIPSTTTPGGATTTPGGGTTEPVKKGWFEENKALVIGGAAVVAAVLLLGAAKKKRPVAAAYAPNRRRHPKG